MLSIDDEVAKLVARYGEELDGPDVLEVTPARFDELAKEAGWQEKPTRLLHAGGELEAVVKVGRRLVRIVPAIEPGREQRG